MHEHQLPDADAAGLDDLLIAASRRLRGAWREGLDALGDVELAPHDARALLVIGRHAPVRPGVIADHLRIAPRSATDVVDRLERQGLVTRGPDPHDRRATVVSLTREGAAVLRAVKRNRGTAASAHFSVLSPDEQATLAALLRRLV